MKSARKDGFTLVELLVVIGIIALLISILLPTLNAARNQAKKVVCLSNLRTLGQCLLLYTTENQGKGLFGAYKAQPAAPYTTASVYWFGMQQGTPYTMDPKLGYLTKYYKNPAFLNCPVAQELLVKYGGALDVANMPVTTYAYNVTAFSVVTNPASPNFGGGAASLGQIRQPAETFGLMDAMLMNPDGMGGTTTTGVYAANPPYSTKDQDFHGRHNGTGNVLWYDGHVSSERPYLSTLPSHNRYSSSSLAAARYKAKLGFLTPLTPANTPEADLFANPTTSTVNFYYWPNKTTRK